MRGGHDVATGVCAVLGAVMRFARIAGVVPLTVTLVGFAPSNAQTPPPGPKVLALRKRVEEAKRRNAKLNAIVEFVVDGEQLAAELDQGLESGSNELDGYVVAVKANIDLESFPANAGAKATGRRSTIGLVDAEVVRRIGSAGGLIIGTTNMDTWARGTATRSERYGTTGNAWDPKRSPFGSSGGSAVAVASGIVDVALGTDTCGSIRYPAAANGIFGLRPTRGAVSRVGVVPLSWTQDVVGPLARSVDDLEKLFRVIAGPDDEDSQTPQPPNRARSNRVGVLSGFGSPEPTILRALRSTGHELVTVDGRGLAKANVIDDEYEPGRDLWRQNLDWWKPFNDAYVRRDRAGYQSRLNAQTRLRESLNKLLDANNLDALVYPTTVAPPGRRGEKQVTANCWLSANTAMPALAVPGPMVNGFPRIGVDLLGRSFDEDTLFAIAHAIAPDPRPIAPER